MDQDHGLVDGNVAPGEECFIAKQTGSKGENRNFRDELMEVADGTREKERVRSSLGPSQEVLSNRQLWSTNMPFPRHPSCGYIRPVP